MLEVAVVGAGVAGRRHIERLVLRDDTAVVGVADRCQARRDDVAATFGIRTYDSTEAMLSSLRIDAAFVCLPPDQHGAVERMCLDAGVPMLVEKPIGVDLATPEELDARITASGVPVAVGYQWRQLSFLPAALAELGDRPVDLVIASWMGPPGKQGWWGDVRSAGGQLVEQATHLIDLAILISGPLDVVSAVASQRRIDDSPTGVRRATSVAARFRNGAAGSFVCTCALTQSYRRSLEVIADDFALVITDTGAHCISSSARRSWTHEPPDPIVREHDAFLELVSTGATARPLATYAQALAAHRAASAMEQLLAETLAPGMPAAVSRGGSTTLWT